MTYISDLFKIYSKGENTNNSYIKSGITLKLISDKDAQKTKHLYQNSNKQANKTTYRLILVWI